MEINKFNQTMKYLTRPAERPGQSLEDLTVTTDLPEEGMEFQSVIEGFGEGLDRNERKNFKRGGSTVRPTQEAYKKLIQEIKDFVAAKKAAGEEIFHEDLLKLTGKKKVSENVYILKAAGVLDDVTKLGQEGRGPVQKRVQKLVDETVDDFYTGKRPINDLKPELLNKEISEKTGLTKIGKRNLNNYLNKNPKYKEMAATRNSVIQSVAKQRGETKENLKKITYLEAKEGDVVAKARPRLPQPKGVEDSILRDLRRYAVQNKNKGALFQIIEDSKSYNQLKIFDAEAGETLDKGKIIKYIKQNDPRFQEYVQTFKDVRKIKNKKYGDGTLNDALKKIKRGGVDASIQLGHVDTVGVNPLRNLEPQLKFANLAAVKKGTDFKQLGLQAPKGEGGIPRKLTAEENITRFVKFADRTLKTPKPGTKFYSGLAALPEMGRISKEMITQDVPKFGRFAGQVAKGAGLHRALVGPVEIPVSLAAGGVYANYQDRVDFEKAVRQTDYSENKKKDLINKFRRSQLDLDVGVGEEILVDTMGTESDIIGGIKDPKQLRQFQKMARNAIDVVRAQEFADLEDERRDAALIEKDELF